MCGRYSFFHAIDEAELLMDAGAAPYMEFIGRYNAAPTQAMPVITNEFPGIIQFFRWGLLPRWAKTPADGNKMINTRAESIRDKPGFQAIFRYKRCVVFADGYYEWMPELRTVTGAKRVAQKIVKQPYRILPEHEGIMLFAGLWEVWSGMGDGVYSFSIITTEANEELKPIHDRMPVILTPEEARLWLSNDISPTQLMKLMRPAPAGWLKWYPVSTRLNSPGNDDAGLVESC